MIFGDRDEFALEVDRFEPPWEVVDPHDESVWAAVAIWVAGSNLAEHRRSGTDRVRNDLHMPLVPLARWAVNARAALRYEERSQVGAFSSPHDELERWSAGPPTASVDEAVWLDRRDIWWSQHFTGAATLDVLAPSLGIVRNDDRALISWRAPELPRTDRIFVRPRGSEVVGWRALSYALEGYVEAVSSWAPIASCAGVSGPERAFEYYTGLAASELPAFGFMPEAADDPAADPLAQVVRDLTHRTATGPARQSIIDFVRAAAQPAGCRWWDLRQNMVLASAIHLEHEGYDAAQTVRSLLDLDSEPIPKMDRFTNDLDIEIADESPAATADRMVVVGGANRRATTMLLANPRTTTAWGRRFELARALGHLLLDPIRGESIGAASGPHAMASRRRRTGAFAAELLLPTSALEDASGGSLDGITEGPRFTDLLERFGVGAQTAAFQLWNHGLLSSTEVRDDLLASV